MFALKRLKFLLQIRLFYKFSNQDISHFHNVFLLTSTDDFNSLFEKLSYDKLRGGFRK